MLGEMIVELRKARGINQVELARILGVSKQCISNWENGNVQPSIEMLIKIANYFCVSTDFLLGLDNKLYLEISGLSKDELMHIQQLINDLIKK